MADTRIAPVIFVLYDVWGNFLRASPNRINKRYERQTVVRYVPEVLREDGPLSNLPHACGPECNYCGKGGD